MRKNNKIHFMVESSFWEVLKREAEEINISLAELCRQKLKKSSQLNKIESLLEKISKQLEKNE